MNTEKTMQDSRTGTIRNIPEVKKKLRGKRYQIIGVNEGGTPVGIIDGETGVFSLPSCYLEPDKTA